MVNIWSKRLTFSVAKMSVSKSALKSAQRVRFRARNASTCEYLHEQFEMRENKKGDSRVEISLLSLKV